MERNEQTTARDVCLLIHAHKHAGVSPSASVAACKLLIAAVALHLGSAFQGMISIRGNPGFDIGFSALRPSWLFGGSGFRAAALLRLDVVTLSCCLL